MNDEPYCVIPISNEANYTALVSQQDYNLVKDYKWSRYEQQSKPNNPVIVVTRIDGKLVQMHHLILGKPKDKYNVFIHTNNNKLDNRRNNLKTVEKKLSLINKIKSLKPMEDTEEYKSHPVLSNYIANVKGDVFRAKDHLKILGSSRILGYNQLTLTTNEGTKCYKMRHVFVYECFHGLVPDGHEIDHIKNDKQNNHLSNLQCLSIKEHHIKTVKDNPDMGAKIGFKLSKPIIAMNLETSIETEYASLTEASSNLPGTTITKICSVLQGRRKTHQGYTFKYQEIDEHIEDEIWVCLANPLYKDIEVSNLGRVKSKRGVITIGNSHGDYRRISVSQDNNKKCVFVHQLVCEAFNGKNPKADEYTVDHIDRDPTNNQASNLRWASKYEQRLNTKDVNQIQVFDENNNLVSTYETITETASKMKMHRKTVRNCCITGRKYNNYSLKFVNNTD
jgi:HNH endonuclease